MGEIAAGIPPLGEENVCIPGLFADARRDAPGDSIKRKEAAIYAFCSYVVTTKYYLIKHCIES
jgi:hypothetical protein